MSQNRQITEEIRNRKEAILKDWIDYQLSGLTLRRDLLKESELREASRQFLDLFTEAFGVTPDIAAPVWKPLKDNLT